MQAPAYRTIYTFLYMLTFPLNHTHRKQRANNYSHMLVFNHFVKTLNGLSRRAESVGCSHNYHVSIANLGTCDPIFRHEITILDY